MCTYASISTGRGDLLFKQAPWWLGSLSVRTIGLDFLRGSCLAIFVPVST